MTEPIPGLRGHVAPCSCAACVDERVAAINASLDAALLVEDSTAPDLTAAQREDVRDWARRNLRPSAVVIHSPWRPDDLSRPRNRAERRRGVR